MVARRERGRAWRIAGPFVSAVVLAAIAAGATDRSPLALAAACMQVGGAAVMALVWPERRGARFLVFVLLCLAAWVAWTGIVASLAISTALALFFGFLHLAAPPATTVRRAVTFAAFAFDTVAAAFTVLPPPDVWRWSVLLMLDVSVIICCWLAAVSWPERRRLIVPVVVPIVALCAVLALEDACGLAGCLSPIAGAVGIARPTIALTIPFGFVMGLYARPRSSAR